MLLLPRSLLKYFVLYVRYFFVRALSPLFIRWQPLQNPLPGYTILIGCHGELAPIAFSNLRLLQRQQRDHLHKIILIFDRPRDQIAVDIQSQCESHYPDLPLEFRYYTRLQRRFVYRFASPAIFAWLSWSIGIAATQTRHAFLHDFDLLLLNSDFFETRYQTLRNRNIQYLGIQAYAYNGFTQADSLVATIELGFDAAFVRKNFKPGHIFNYVGLRRSQPLDYDTLLHAQKRAGQTDVYPIAFGDLVHPSQMISQYTRWRRQTNITEVTRLPLIPYYLHLADHTEPLARATTSLQLAKKQGTRIVHLLDGTANLCELTAEQVRIFCLDMSLVEKAIYQHVRPEVQSYIDALRTFIASSPDDLAA